MLGRIRVHKICENDQIEYHFEKISASIWPQYDPNRHGYYSTDAPGVELREEIGENLAHSMPGDNTLLTMFVDTGFGFAGGYFEDDEQVAVEMAKHVLLCTRGCVHQKHTALAF